MLVLFLWGGSGAWAGALPDMLMRLSDGTPRVEIWDQATALADPSGALGLADVRAHEAEFRPLTGPRANLGRRAGAVWLRIPVQAADDSKGHWVLQIDYPSLDRIELYVFDGLRKEALPPLLERGTVQAVVAVYLIDLDGFKAVNDRHGHAVGDLLLQEVARVLRREAREAALWSRLGGDEFVVVTTGLRSDADAERLGLRMLAAFDSPIDAAGVSCSIGLTIGYALAPEDGDTATALLPQADAAMHAGKQDGRLGLRRGRATVGSA
jgi:diguanylate cyclase (GGDEF)-like protein